MSDPIHIPSPSQPSSTSATNPKKKKMSAASTTRSLLALGFWLSFAFLIATNLLMISQQTQQGFALFNDFSSSYSSSWSSYSSSSQGSDVLDLNQIDDDDDDGNADSSTSATNMNIPIPAIERPSCYQSPMLPKKIYTVLGLESSGTSFTARVIKEGLRIQKTREAHRNYPTKHGSESDFNDPDYDMEDEHIQTQHFSLPWGSSCQAEKETPIVDVVLPPQCTRRHGPSFTNGRDTDEVMKCCNAMANELFGITPNGQPVKYPRRYNVDIVSTKDWYDAHGVEQWMIIVLRDPDISIAARSHSHCTNKERLLEEERAGKDIIIDAINKYILEEGERKVTRETYKFWYAKNFQGGDPAVVKKAEAASSEGRRNLRALTSSSNLSSFSSHSRSGLTSKNNVVLVSYESMMGLGDVYIKLLYKTLGIDTDHQPKVKNGNTKYIKGA